MGVWSARRGTERDGILIVLIARGIFLRGEL